MTAIDLDKFQWPEDFGPVPLPSWIKRDARWQQQLEVAKQIVREFDTKDLVLLQAPTGTGKTLIGELVRRLMFVDAAYVCDTKALQHQFASDFPYAKVLKGRSNYMTMSGPLNALGLPTHESRNEITCADCNFDFERGVCSWCTARSSCPYVIAKGKAQASTLAVLNTSYLLADYRSSAAFARPLTIIDEADKLESVLLSNVEVTLTERHLGMFGLNPPKHKTVDTTWPQWTKDAAEAIAAYLEDMPDPTRSNATQEEIRNHRQVSNLLDKMTFIAGDISNGNWVYDGYKRGNVTFRPVHVGKYGHHLLWNTGQKFLLMSATILSSDILIDDIGYCYARTRPYETIDIPSSFPVENRPVHYVPVADMTYKNKEAAWPAMASAVEGVLNLHPDERVLVHSVSYELAMYLIDQLKSKVDRPLVTYVSSSGKDRALKEYKSRRRAVMIAASMDRGIDLPGDMCRVQVIAKVPWPNTADKRINARMYQAGGSAWYQSQAIRDIIQMTGRAVRHREDTATTYILDEQFGKNLWSNADYMFPKWWTDALNWRFNKRKLFR